MLIEQELPRRLVLVDPCRPIAAGIGLAIAAILLFVVTPLAYEQNGLLTAMLAVAATALPLVWSILLLRRCNVTFDADKGVAIVARSKSPSAKRWTIPLDQIEELYLHRSSNPEGGVGFQPFIATTQGAVQMTLTVYDLDQANAALDAAERFLAAAGLSVKRIGKPKTWHMLRDRAADP